MSKTIVPDNMSAIIKRADALTPTIVEAFLDYVVDRKSKALSGVKGNPLVT